MELPAELPAAVQEVWFVLVQCTVVVGVAVVGVAVIKLVSAPGQPVHLHWPRQVLEIGTPFLFHLNYNVYIATLFKLLG